MALRVDELEALAAHLNQSAHQRVTRIQQIDRDTLRFRLGRNQTLVLSLRNQNPLVYVETECPEEANLATTLSAFFRKRFSNAELLSVSVFNGDRVLKFEFSTVNDIFELETLFLFCELIPTKANLIVTDEDLKTLMVLRPTTLTSVRPLLRGVTYEPPAKADHPLLPSEPFDVEKYFHQCAREEANQRANRNKNHYQDFFASAKTKIKSLKRKIARLEEDIQSGKEHLNDFEYGNYIYTYKEELKEGIDHIEIDGVRVSLDPKKSLIANANAFFKSAKKAKNSVEIGTKIKLESEKELVDLTNLLSLASTADPEALALLVKTFGTRQKGGSKENHSNDNFKLLPYVAEFDGFRVLFAKNAKQNDFLTFSYATNPNYLWVHIKDQVGAHVILPLAHPTPEQTQAACEIALLASGKADGEVQFTEHKNIRRGHVPGLAILSTYVSVQIREISPEVKDAYNKALENRHE